MPAGQVTSLSGYIPQKYTNMALVLTTRNADLIKTGVIVRSAKLDQFMTKGGVIFDMPFWNDIGIGTGNEGTADVARQPNENFSADFGNPTDNPHAGLGGANTGYDPAPNRITSSKEIGVRCSHNASWAQSDLSNRLLLGDIDPLTFMAGRSAFFQEMDLQRVFLATMTGLFADNDLSPTGTDQHVLGDMTLDISNAAGTGIYQSGVTDFGAPAHIRALQILGDRKSQIKVVMMHSILESTIALKNLIETVRDSDGQVLYNTFMGMRIVVNDEMTSPSAGVYDTFYFKPASLLLGVGQPDVPLEWDRKPGAANGGGQTIFYSRWEWALHPIGYQWKVASTGAGPTFAELAAAASWSRVYPERKQVGIIRVRSREF